MARYHQVSQELHDKVLQRDGCCFVYRINPEHVCRDKYGVPHGPKSLRYLTVDHVHMEPGGVKGRRAPDDEQHLIAMCAQINVEGPSRAIREAEREYLRNLYPDVI